jgi:hypothetical protein
MLNNINWVEEMFKNKGKYEFEYEKNWYFNVDNFSNSKLIFETFDFLNKIEREFEYSEEDKELYAICFVNKLYKQYLEVNNFLEFPFDYIDHVETAIIKYSEIDKNYFYGFLIKWYGGYPVNNSNKKIETIINLVFRKIEPFLSKEKNKGLKDFFTNTSNINKLQSLEQLLNDTINNKPIQIEQNENFINAEPIKWQKDIVLLAYLFNELQLKGLIKDNKLWKKLSNFFIDKEGKNIKNTTFPNLITSYGKTKTKHNNKSVPTEHKDISDIISVLVDVVNQTKK